MKCPKCNKKIKKYKICPFCGVNLEEIRNAKKENVKNTILKIKCRIAIILILIFIILVSVIVGMNIYFSKKNFKQYEEKNTSSKNTEKLELEDLPEYEEDFEFKLTDENKSQDSDGDGLTNEKEVELGTDPMVEDTDLDGLTDGDEVNKHKSDPLKFSTSGDDISDSIKVKLKLDLETKYSEDDIEIENIEANSKVTLIPDDIESYANGKFEEYYVDTNTNSTEKIFSVFGFVGDIEYQVSATKNIILLTDYEGKYEEYDKYEVEDGKLVITIDKEDNGKNFIITTNGNYKEYLSGKEEK